MTIHKTPALSRTGWISVSHLPSVHLAACLLIVTSVFNSQRSVCLPHPLQHVCLVHHRAVWLLPAFFSLLLEVYTAWFCLLTGSPFLSISSFGRGWRSFRRNCWMMCMRSRWKQCRTWSSVSASSSRPPYRLLSMSSRRERTSYNSSGDNY